MNRVTDADIHSVKQRLEIVGNSPQLMAAITRALQVAPIDLSVLVTGESGTGKEFFPKIIHNGSARKHNKYIAVNCGAIPEGTIDSELFGHEKGSFTGAVGSRKGYFEEADGGTIFLDEVAELPLSTQARLLRVLETGEFLKVGSSTVQKTNIRVVAATNVDMLKAVAEGRFREDLYYRLSTVQISVPPLRDRGADIVLLARKFAMDFSERYRTPAITFSDDAKHLMSLYRWPGNVRQLKNVVEQLALFDAGSDVSVQQLEACLPAEERERVYTPTLARDRQHSYDAEREVLFGMILRLQREVEGLKAELGDRPAEMAVQQPAAMELRHGAPRFSETSPCSIVKYTPAVPSASLVVPGVNVGEPAVEPEVHSSMTLEDTERETIRRSLERNGGRRKATAQELNISERTLYRKIKEYGLE